jgi:hypothetical protein
VRVSKSTFLPVKCFCYFQYNGIDPRLPQDKEKLYFTDVFSLRIKNMRKEGEKAGERR